MCHERALCYCRQRTDRDECHVALPRHLTTDTYWVSENGLTSKRLEVNQQPRAVYNNDTDQWSVDLACGVFDYRNNPPFDVEWLVGNLLHARAPASVCVAGGG